jgi:hypothetical protein
MLLKSSHPHTRPSAPLAYLGKAPILAAQREGEVVVMGVLADRTDGEAISETAKTVVF